MPLLLVAMPIARRSLTAAIRPAPSVEASQAHQHLQAACGAFGALFKADSGGLRRIFEQSAKLQNLGEKDVPGISQNW